MAANPAAPVPNPVRLSDAEILIEILALLKGALWSGAVDEYSTRKIAGLFVQQGLLAADHDQVDLRKAIGDMIQRLRSAAGKYDSSPSALPLPP